jgi:hypothetical protein
MGQAGKFSSTEISRRRAAARLRGLFADVAPDKDLVDELIADRRQSLPAEAQTKRSEAK